MSERLALFVAECATRGLRFVTMGLAVGSGSGFFSAGNRRLHERRCRRAAGAVQQPIGRYTEDRGDRGDRLALWIFALAGFDQSDNRFGQPSEYSKLGCRKIACELTGGRDAC